MTVMFTLAKPFAKMPRPKRRRAPVLTIYRGSGGNWRSRGRHNQSRKIRSPTRAARRIGHRRAEIRILIEKQDLLLQRLDIADRHHVALFSIGDQIGATGIRSYRSAAGPEASACTCTIAMPSSMDGMQNTEPSR